MFPAVALTLLLCPLPPQVFLSSLRSPLQLTNLDRGLLLATGSLLVYYMTPQLFRPVTSPLLSFTGPLVSFMGPLPSSQVLSYLSRSSSIFTGPVLSFTGPLPFSWVPFHFHGSPSIFTGPLPFSRVPFHFHGSPSIFTGPLPFSRVPSSPSLIPFHSHRSTSIFKGPLLSFTGPLHFHGSPSIFTGPLLSFTGTLLSSRDLSHLPTSRYTSLVTITPLCQLTHLSNTIHTSLRTVTLPVICHTFLVAILHPSLCSATVTLH